MMAANDNNAQKILPSSQGMAAFWKRITLSFFIVLLLFIACLAVLFIFTGMVLKNNLFTIDARATAYVNSIATPGLTSFMSFITFFGSQNFLVPANLLLIFFYLLIKKKRRTAIHITTVAVVSVSVLFLLKDLIRRTRPLQHIMLRNAKGYSFPSGHTVSSVTFFGTLIYIAWKNIKNKTLRWITVIFLFIMPFLVGASRIYLGAHYASDVIAGFCVGTIWLLLADRLLLTRKNDPTKKLMTVSGSGRSLRMKNSIIAVRKI